MSTPPPVCSDSLHFPAMPCTLPCSSHTSPREGRWQHRLVEDTAWHPIEKDVVDKWSPLQKRIVSSVLGSPLKLWASVGHWLIWHFNLSLYTERQRPRVRLRLRLRAASRVAMPVQPGLL